ncbi:MAG TPA: DUF4190 domain-containing protein [Candidatus Acidoferrum sp.]|nr:DUF4190 domain-containing protein [Candidatus Acidoferrum sp.]
MYRIIGADGRQYGPVAANDVLLWIAEGRVAAQTLALAEGAPQWKPLAQFVEFAPALAGRGAAPPAAFPVLLAPVPSNNAMAVTALIMGILAIIPGMCCCHGLPFNLLGIIFALVALSQIRRDPMAQQGRGMAVAGLVLCLLSVLMSIIFVLFAIAISVPDILRNLH